MKIHIISGSHRSESQSTKVSNYLSTELLAIGVEVTMNDLSVSPLPLIASSQTPTDDEVINRDAYVAMMKDCDALIVVTPEWNGAATPGIINALELVKTEAWFKPALIVTVSSSRGGAYPVAQLRSFSSKNNRINYIPEHIIVRNVKDVLNSAITDLPEDTYIRERITFALNILKEYAETHIDLRARLNIDSIDPRFANGM
jgi:NAD(P)H-dependent FMN reductase